MLPISLQKKQHLKNIKKYLLHDSYVPNSQLKERQPTPEKGTRFERSKKIQAGGQNERKRKKK